MELTKEQQAQQLKEEYTRKLEEIQTRPETTPETPPQQVEHQAVSETTEGAIQQHMPEFKASSHEPGRPSEVSPEAQAQVQEMINMIWTKNLDSSVQAVKDANNPSLTDEYHRALTSDENWQRLVKEGKIPQL